MTGPDRPSVTGGALKGIFPFVGVRASAATRPAALRDAMRSEPPFINAAMGLGGAAAGIDRL